MLGQPEICLHPYVYCEEILHFFSCVHSLRFARPNPVSVVVSVGRHLSCSLKSFVSPSVSLFSRSQKPYLLRNRPLKMESASLPSLFSSSMRFPPLSISLSLFPLPTLAPLISFRELLDNDIAGNRQSLTELVIMN